VDQPILICGDDDALVSRLHDDFALAGYTVATAGARRAAVLALADRRPALLVTSELDGLAGTLSLIRDLRGYAGGTMAVDPDVPTLIVSSGLSELVELRALDAGADDVVDAAISPLVLLARARTLLWRAGLRRRPRWLRVGQLVVDPAARTARYAGQPLPLTPREFQLLRRLASDPERVHTRAELLAEVWGDGAGQLASRTIDAHAARLRRKLADAGADQAIDSVRGMGYRLDVDGPRTPEAA
jgi:DNA-binding response OmpR family regulator